MINIEDQDIDIDIDIDRVTTDDDGMTSYEEIWSNVIMSGELVLTVAMEDVDLLKTGIKNVKARQAADNKAAELPIVQGTLSFITVASKEIPGAMDVTITLTQKGLINVLGMRVPDTEL